jgi:hypothetical protein
MALAKFGSFGQLSGTTSSAVDPDPSTPTFTSSRSQYSSSYMSFVGVEFQSSHLSSSGTTPT